MAVFTQIILPVLSIFATAIASALVAFFAKQSKTYKKALEEEQARGVRQVVQDELEPVIEEIHRLHERIERTENSDEIHWGLILEQYKFRLIQLCKTYLRQGYMTQEQYDQLSEFYRIYSGLGGNGQAQEYYQRVLRLEICEDDEN